MGFSVHQIRHNEPKIKFVKKKKKKIKYLPYELCTLLSKKVSFYPSAEYHVGLAGDKEPMTYWFTQSYKFDEDYYTNTEVSAYTYEDASRILREKFDIHIWANPHYPWWYGNSEYCGDWDHDGDARYHFKRESPLCEAPTYYGAMNKIIEWTLNQLTDISC